MLKPPREYDECIMEKLVKQGVRGSKLASINTESASIKNLFSFLILRQQMARE